MIRVATMEFRSAERVAIGVAEPQGELAGDFVRLAKLSDGDAVGTA
jgi:hypothetical protein